MLTATAGKGQIIEGFKMFVDGLNENTTEAINEVEIVLKSISSENLDLLARVLLKEVARREIEDQNISPRVYVAAELLLLKKEE